MSTLAAAAAPLHTPQDVLRLEEQGLFELVDGVLVEKKTSRKSTRVVGAFTGKLFAYFESHSIGEVMPEQSYRCFPNEPLRVRRPDVSVVLVSRFEGDPQWDGHITIRPDLVVEVVSPDDLAEDVEQKVEHYRRAGVSLVWVAYPQSRVLHVHRADGTVTALRPGDTLTGEWVLPGFSVPIDALLPAVPPVPVPNE